MLFAWNQTLWPPKFSGWLRHWAVILLWRNQLKQLSVSKTVEAPFTEIENGSLCIKRIALHKPVSIEKIRFPPTYCGGRAVSLFPKSLPHCSVRRCNFGDIMRQSKTGSQDCLLRLFKIGGQDCLWFTEKKLRSLGDKPALDEAPNVFCDTKKPQFNVSSESTSPPNQGEFYYTRHYHYRLERRLKYERETLQTQYQSVFLQQCHKTFDKKIHGLLDQIRASG